MWPRLFACSALILAGAADASAGYITLHGLPGEFGLPSSSPTVELLADSTTNTFEYFNSSTASGQERYIDAWGEIANGAIRLRLDSWATNPTLRASVRDQYVLSGPIGETVSLTVHLEVDGFTRYVGTAGGVRIVRGEIGGDHHEDGFAGLSPIFSQEGVATEDNNTNVEFMHDFDVTHTFDATVGVPFQLAYSVAIIRGNPRPGPAGSVLTDLTNTATVRFDLPEGFSLTSQSGFGAPTENAEVPEPGSMALLGSGIAGMGWFVRRRGMPLRRTA